MTEPTDENVQALGPFTEENGWHEYELTTYDRSDGTNYVVTAKTMQESFDIGDAVCEPGQVLSIDPEGGTTAFDLNTFRQTYRPKR
jgi:hypothetical protein